MVNISVSLPDEVLQELDRAAHEPHTTCSASITQAIVRFLVKKEEDRKRERRREAAAAMDRTREEFGGRDGTAEVLRWRDVH